MVFFFSFLFFLLSSVYIFFNWSFFIGFVTLFLSILSIHLFISIAFCYRRSGLMDSSRDQETIKDTTMSTLVAEHHQHQQREQQSFTSYLTLRLPMFPQIQFSEKHTEQFTRIVDYLQDCLTTVLVTIWATSPVLAIILYVYLLVNYVVLRTPLFMYLVFCIFDPRPYDGVGRRFPIISKLPIWTYVAKYFQTRMVFEEPLDSQKRYVFGTHPHGVIGYMSQLIGGCTGLGLEAHYPGLIVRGVTMPATFGIPFFRDYALAMGCLSCDRDSIRSILSNKHKDKQSLLVVVGGAQESMLAHENHADLVLLKRRGFITEAIKAGCDLVPIYNFNENSIYKLLPNPPGSLVYRFEMTLRNLFGFTILLFHGRNIFFTPYKTQLTSVVGKPIKVEMNTDPTVEDIKKYHNLYVKELERIFNKYRPIYAPDSKDLRFVA